MVEKIDRQRCMLTDHEVFSLDRAGGLKSSEVKRLTEERRKLPEDELRHVLFAGKASKKEWEAFQELLDEELAEDHEWFEAQKKNLGPAMVRAIKAEGVKEFLANKP